MIVSQGKEEFSKGREQHLFIFDWDDTLLCTTYLQSCDSCQLSQEGVELLQQLDRCASKLLLRAAERGQWVVIVTNAAEGWVEQSSKQYLPRTHEIIEQQSIRILSARQEFEKEYPGDYVRWKTQAFKRVLAIVDRKLTYLICVGDSLYELEAANSLPSAVEDHLIKTTIKFREKPRPEDLIQQQEMVYARMQQICSPSQNVAIRLERKSGKQHPMA